MSGQVPDLLIPIRLDDAAARQQLQQLHQLLQQQAAQAVASVGARDTGTGTSGTGRTQNPRQVAQQQMAAAREVNALLKQFARDEEKLAKDRAAAEKKAAQDSFATWKQAQDQQHREAMQAWTEKQSAIRATAKAEKDAASQRVATSRAINALLQQFARDEEKLARDRAAADVRAARSAAAARRQADRETFAAWKAAQDIRHRETMEAWEIERAAVKESSSEIAKLIKTGLGLAAVSRVAHFIGDEFRKASEYVAEMSKKFADLRTALQQVSALRNTQNTNKFTAEQIKTAAKAGLTPQEWTQAQEAFLNPAGAQIGDHVGAKMTDEQAQEFQIRLARLSKSKGISPAVGMEFGASILEQSKGPLTPDQAMAQVNPALKILQEGRIELSRGLPMMSQIMSHGIPANQAATLLSTTAMAAPGQETTTVEGSLRALEEMRVAGKENQFGVTNKMSKYEGLKAFGQNIIDRDQANLAQGMTEEESEVVIAKQLKDAGVADDIRERRGIIRGIARGGVKLGGFARFEAIGQRTAADADLTAVKAFEESDEGMAARRRAEEAKSEAEMGLRGDRLAALRMKAETSLRNQGKFENVPKTDLALGLTPFSDSVRDQQINRMAIQMARRDLGEQFTAGDLNHSLNRGLTDSLLRDLIKRGDDQKKEAEKQTEIMKADQAQNRQRAAPNLAAPPPMRGGGRRN